MRLIDADALKRWIETNKANANPLDYNTKATYAECITMVETMETVDSVPVVRCKDCKSFKEYTPEFKASNECVEGADGDCITRLLYSDAHPQFSAVRNGDYCSLGVKINLEGCP